MLLAVRPPTKEGCGAIGIHPEEVTRCSEGWSTLPIKTG